MADPVVRHKVKVTDLDGTVRTEEREVSQELIDRVLEDLGLVEIPGPDDEASRGFEEAVSREIDELDAELEEWLAKQPTPEEVERSL